MPYLRITCPYNFKEKFPSIAERLTKEINLLFYNSKARLSREELRERTTIHFIPYEDKELFIGARTPNERGFLDITVELSDWLMSVKQQRKVAKHLTSVLAELFGLDDQHLENVNMRFHSYPPSDFSVGGKLLSDIIPLPGRIAKKIFS